jgi:amino acid transporter
MLGTGVMIGAGIFALTGQMAQVTGVLFPRAFLAAAVIVALSAYSYINISNTYPCAGGIGMYLRKAYGDLGAGLSLSECKSDLLLGKFRYLHDKLSPLMKDHFARNL